MGTISWDSPETRRTSGERICSLMRNRIREEGRERVYRKNTRGTLESQAPAFAQRQLPTEALAKVGFCTGYRAVQSLS